MTQVDEERILRRAHLSLDMSVIARALLDGDFDEARFRVVLVHEFAFENGLREVADATLTVVGYLGESNAVPREGIGPALLELSDAVDRLE